MDGNQLQQTRNAQGNLQTYSPSNDLARINAAMQEFGADYKPLVFDRYSKAVGIEKSVEMKAPTFRDITMQYSEDAATFWLRYHIADTFVFLGIFDQTTRYQIRQTAELILQHEIYGQLTLQEFLCFLTRFKQGRYEKIYNVNHPNPQEFLKCLQPFWSELSYWRGKQAEKEQQERLSKEIHDTPSPTPEEQAEIEEIKQRLSNKFRV